jgi:hypothetical protein
MAPNRPTGEHKPSSNEDEYFLKLDAEILKEKRAKLDAERLAAERHSHFMRCPKCGGELVEREFHHAKVDECRDCHGVWLDAGEVNQLLQVRHGALDNFVRTLFGSRGEK